MNPLNEAKVELGRALFHSPLLGTQAELTDYAQTYSCASCHNLHYGDVAGAPQGIGEGGVGGVFNSEGYSLRVINPSYQARR